MFQYTNDTKGDEKMSEYINPVDQAKHDYMVEGDKSNPYQGEFRRKQTAILEVMADKVRDNIFGDASKSLEYSILIQMLVDNRKQYEDKWMAYEQAFDQCEIDELKIG